MIHIGDKKRRLGQKGVICNDDILLPNDNSRRQLGELPGVYKSLHFPSLVRLEERDIENKTSIVYLLLLIVFLFSIVRGNDKNHTDQLGIIVAHLVTYFPKDLPRQLSTRDHNPQLSFV